MILKYRDGDLYYTDQGYGETVVLIHGYLESADVWSGFETRLAKNYRVICLDLPGHGRSGTFSETHTMEFLAETINYLLEYLNVSGFFIVGHSLGGYVSLAFLELFSYKLKGYCLFHSHPFNDSEAAIAKRNREIDLVQKGMKDRMYPENVSKMFADKNLERFSADVERSKSIASKQPANGIIAILKGMIIRPSRISLMEKGEVPCLWILGTLDNYIPYETMSKKVSLPSNAELYPLSDSGHMGFIEEEDTSLEALTRFITKYI